MSLPEPLVDGIKVDDPSGIELERYDMDPVYHHRVRVVWNQQLEAWKNLRNVMGDEERRLFEKKLLALSMHIVTNSTVVSPR